MNRSVLMLVAVAASLMALACKGSGYSYDEQFGTSAIREATSDLASEDAWTVAEALQFLATRARLDRQKHGEVQEETLESLQHVAAVALSAAWDHPSRWHGMATLCAFGTSSRQYVNWVLLHGAVAYLSHEATSTGWARQEWLLVDGKGLSGPAR